MSLTNQASVRRRRFWNSLLIGFVASILGSFFGAYLTNHYFEEIDGYVMKCDGWVVEVSPLSDCQVAVEEGELLLIRRDGNYTSLGLMQGTSLHDLIYTPMGSLRETLVLTGPAVYEITNGESVTHELLSANDWQNCMPGFVMEVDMRSSWTIPCNELPPYQSQGA